MGDFPEDWPAGPCDGGLRALDGELRCQICHELYTAPLSLRCGHACALSVSRDLLHRGRGHLPCAVTTLVSLVDLLNAKTHASGSPSPCSPCQPPGC